MGAGSRKMAKIRKEREKNIKKEQGERSKLRREQGDWTPLREAH